MFSRHSKQAILLVRLLLKRVRVGQIFFRVNGNDFLHNILHMCSIVYMATLVLILSPEGGSFKVNELSLLR